MVTTLFRTLSLHLALCQIMATLAGKSSQLQVYIPKSLFKTDGYDHRESLFGPSPHNGSITQNVYYADSELCEMAEETRHGGYPVRETDEGGKMAPWPSPFILMVDRGSCSFVQKVRIAQQLGAAGVIIADNSCLCSDKKCMDRSSSSQNVCQTKAPIMADDGSGSDISIPSFLMFKTDADRIKDELKDNHMVLLEMAWPSTNPDDRVEYDLWMVPSNPNTKDFIHSFRPLAESLGTHAYFTPHMYIYDGIKSHCQGNNGENMCYNLCTNNGRYCATAPGNDLTKGISGADIVTESLRQICIWKYYGEADGIGHKWWRYNEEFLDRCDSPDNFMNQTCVNDALEAAKIEKNKINQCMKDSGGLEGDNGNSLLNLEIQSQADRGVVILPTVFVNTFPLRGPLSVNSVFDAICAGYAKGTQPEICITCTGRSDLINCVENKDSSSSSHGGNGDQKLFQIFQKLFEIIFSH